MRMKVKLFGGLRNLAGNAQIEASGGRIREVLETPVSRNDQMAIFPPIAGGY